MYCHGTNKENLELEFIHGIHKCEPGFELMKKLWLSDQKGLVYELAITIEALKSSARTTGSILYGRSSKSMRNQKDNKINYDGKWYNLFELFLKLQERDQEIIGLKHEESQEEEISDELSPPSKGVIDMDTMLPCSSVSRPKPKFKSGDIVVRKRSDMWIKKAAVLSCHKHYFSLVILETDSKVLEKGEIMDVGYADYEKEEGEIKGSQEEKKLFRKDNEGFGVGFNYFLCSKLEDKFDDQIKELKKKIKALERIKNEN